LAVAPDRPTGRGQAPRDYVTRLRRSGLWVDQQTERLRRAKPSATVRRWWRSHAWAEGVLAPPVPRGFDGATAADGLDGEASWRGTRRRATDVVKPALQRWAELLRQLLPLARPADRPGAHLPARRGRRLREAVRSHTTMAVTRPNFTRRAWTRIERLEQRAGELGARLGLEGLEAVNDALRASAGTVPAEEAVQAARRAVRRAEDRAAKCSRARCRAVPRGSDAPVVAISGTAPHYTPPRLDGRPAGHLLVQYPGADGRNGLGPRERRLSRGRARSSSPAVAEISRLSELPAMQASAQ